MPLLPATTTARLAGIDWESLRPLAPALLERTARVLAGHAADRELDVLLRSHRTATSLQRRALAEALFGIGLWRRRLAWLVGSDSPPHAIFAFLAAAGAAPELAASLAGLSLPPALREGAPASLADSWSTPDWLAHLLQQELGPGGANDLLAAISTPGPITLRAHTLRGSRDALAARLADERLTTSPTLHAPHGLHVTSPRPNLYGLLAHADALFEVQDEGSQLLGELLEAGEGDAVLDACAGAGGKTLQLACAVGPRGRVHAYDIDAERLSRLQRRAERAGLHHVSIHRGALPEQLRVPRVLVDAPCSELGALRRGPDVRFRTDPASFQRWPPVQLQLLTQAGRHVLPGGRLVYATCTLRREENEAVAEAFEAHHPEFRRALPSWAQPFSHHGFFRALPHLHGTDGFFAAVYDRAA